MRNLFPKSHLVVVVLALVLYFSLTTISFADTPAASEEVDVPVIVNVVDNSDDSNVDDAIEKANEILDQAGINLVVVKTNKPVNIGDNDGDLTYDEGETAQEEGQQELDDTNEDGKGLKLTIADDCWSEEPNTVGWAVHRNPVVVVEPDGDANEMGRTVAHEFCHALTIDYDLYDINDINSLMYGYTDGGIVLGPNEVNEIVGEAKKRGDAHWVIPIVPGRPTMMPPGIEYSIDYHGGHVDSFFDVFVESGTIDPCDPAIAFADMREISFFADEPFTEGTTAQLEIQLGGSYYDYPAESFFDVYIDIPFDKDTDPNDELFLNIHIWSLPGDPAIFSEATIEDIEAGLEPIPIPIMIHNNFRYDGPEPILANDSLEVPIPIDFFGPGSDPFDGVISFSVDETVILPDGIVGDANDGSIEVGLTNRCECPGIKLSCPAGGGGGGCAAIGVTGCGFAGDIAIELDGQLVDVVPAASDGSFYGELDTTGLEPGQHEIFVQETDDTGPEGAHYAKGVFLHCPAGFPSSDLDRDCDVDFVDFAYMANEWLFGVE